MKQVSKELEEVIQQTYPLLSAYTEEETSSILPGRTWSRKHILGHLIDSAGNNHQRFIRAQIKKHIDLPGYTQDEWVKFNGYESESWGELIALWKSFNLHLVHVIGLLSEEALTNTISLDGKPPMTLQFVAEDYVRHLRHHLGQILESKE